MRKLWESRNARVWAVPRRAILLAGVPARELARARALVRALNENKIKKWDLCVGPAGTLAGKLAECAVVFGGPKMSPPGGGFGGQNAQGDRVASVGRTDGTSYNGRSCVP